MSHVAPDGAPVNFSRKAINIPPLRGSSKHLLTVHRERLEMKRSILLIGSVALAVLFGVAGARAQSGTVAAGPDPSAVRDVESEQAAKHELEVARHYFKNKKAYYAAFKRCEE